MQNSEPALHRLRNMDRVRSNSNVQRRLRLTAYIFKASNLRKSSRIWWEPLHSIVSYWLPESSCVGRWLTWTEWGETDGGWKVKTELNNSMDWKNRNRGICAIGLRSAWPKFKSLFRHKVHWMSHYLSAKPTWWGRYEDKRGTGWPYVPFWVQKVHIYALEN